MLTRHARPCAGHSRLETRIKKKTWMAGASHDDVKSLSTPTLKRSEPTQGDSNRDQKFNYCQ